MTGTDVGEVPSYRGSFESSAGPFTAALIVSRRALAIGLICLTFVSFLFSKPTRAQCIDAIWTDSGTPSTAGLVRLSGTPLGSGLLTVDVILDGPSPSSDVFGFAFDLLIGDPTVVEFVDGSAVPGTALIGGPLALASQQEDRIVVAVSKFGGVGNGVSNSATVVTLNLRLLSAGSSTLTFVGSPGNPRDPSLAPSVMDSGNGVLSSFIFDSEPAMISVSVPDADSDGISDCEDCAPGDGSVWSTPGEDISVVMNVESSPTVILDWTAPTATGAASVVYDIVRGNTSDLAPAGIPPDYGSCLQNDHSGTTHSDSTDVAPGRALIYMIRAANSCGNGSFGTQERDANSGNCP